MKYTKTFEFCDTAEQAETMCAELNASATRYMRNKHPAHYTPWSSADGTEHKFVVWYYR